jgi:HSP20 family protein
MNKLVPLQKNGSLATSTLDFPTWSNWIDNFFNSDVQSLFLNPLNEGATVPKVNILETKDAYLLELVAPGLKKSDFKIELEGRNLSISSEITEEHLADQESYTRREFSLSSFKRAFTLPDSVNESKISAKYEDGILVITIPKKEEAIQPPARQIEIS